MSAIVDCGACGRGDHSKHDGAHRGFPGLIGGEVCCCTGDCDKRFARRVADLDRQMRYAFDADKPTPRSDGGPNA